MFEENSSNEIIEEKIDEENEILNSEEESEGKNIFKTKRSNSDQNESDDDEENSDRGHKRRKSSRDNSNEKLGKKIENLNNLLFFYIIKVEDKHHNLQNQGIREGNFPKNPNFPKNLPSFGMPMPPFVPMIKGKKKFPMNKNMMKGPFPP